MLFIEVRLYVSSFSSIFARQTSSISLKFLPLLFIYSTQLALGQEIVKRIRPFSPHTTGKSSSTANPKSG
ncbi:MAG: hypothetical protein RSE93_04355 [Oscillospiraceae bacterium]